MTKHTTHQCIKRLDLPWNTRTGAMAELLNQLSPECGQWLYEQTNNGERTLADVAADYVEDAYLEDMEKRGRK